VSLGPLIKVEVTPTPGAIAELAEHFICAPEGEPKLVGYYDRRGKLRRIVATYPDGTRCQVNINAGGFVTSSSTKLPTIKIKRGEADAQG
jgi:hypothetical protein